MPAPREAYRMVPEPRLACTSKPRPLPWGSQTQRLWLRLLPQVWPVRDTRAAWEISLFTEA